MALTVGNGPFGPKTSGTFNFKREGPAHVLYWEECPWRVRCELGGETVADSRHVKLLHETGLLPVYYFPRSDVRQGLLTPTEHSTHCPFKGDARYWSMTVGDRTAENAVWGYDAPIETAPPLADYVALYWSKFDRWFEEDEEAFVHARDPYHRIDVLPSSRSVKVSVGGTVLAQSKRSLILFEAALPPRYYLPREDVHLDRLAPSDTQTRCPYKGLTSGYWSCADAEDIAWCYADPLPAVAPIADRICFYNERVDLDLGE